MILTRLLSESKELPNNSGCYLFKDIKGKVLYVGKAKNLRKRVQSYFQKSKEISAKNQIMIKKITEISFFITNTDAESYILENNLIKEHRPKYNILFRDDKTYPYAKINLKHEFPRIEYIRRPKKKMKQRLLGPYPVGSGISQIIKKLTEVYRLRDCSESEFRSRKKPCLLYQMDKCTAPCVGKINREAYLKDLENAWGFLEGKKIKYTFNHLESKMHKLSEKEKFEEAALTRDLQISLKQFIDDKYEQSVEWKNLKNIDVIGIYSGSLETDISIYQVRRGLLLGYENFHFLNADIEESKNDFLSKFLFQYFEKMEFNRAEQIIYESLDFDLSEFSNILNEAFEQKITFSLPRGDKERGLVEATHNHAKQMQIFREKKNDSVYSALIELQRLLNLEERPRVLECYDVAVWQGKSPTASQVVFSEGKPDKKQYRYYHLQERAEGNNDFAMMKEVLERRLKRDDLPDLFVVDGGRAQLNVFKKVLEEYKMEVPVVGIAKAKNHKDSEERLIIYNRSNPYLLKRHKGLLNLLVAMRDEAHRFSRKLHHKEEKKRVLSSWIDRIPNLKSEVRDKIKENLAYSVEEIKKLSVVDLVKAFQISMGEAKKINNFVKKL